MRAESHLILIELSSHARRVNRRERETMRLQLALVSLVAACSMPMVATEDPPHAKTVGVELANASMQSRAAPGGAETVVWTDRSAPLPSRVGTTMVDQPPRGRVLLYGGWNVDSGVRADTWEWDGIGWLRRVPEEDPGPRFAPATAYDELGQRVILFGGMSSLYPTPTAADALTWEWNGSNWAPILTAHAPTPRSGSAMVWDPKSRRTLLFGGFQGETVDGTDAVSDDVFWAFDGRDWTEIPKQGEWPSARALGAMTVDRRSGHVVMTGGFNFLRFVAGNIDFTTGTRYIDETWEWDGSGWQRIPAVLDDAGREHRAAHVATER